MTASQMSPDSSGGEPSPLARQPERAAPARRPGLAELQRLTAALARLSTIEEIAELCSLELGALSGATTWWVGRVTEDGSYLEMLAADDASSAAGRDVLRLPLGEASPVCETVRVARPLWFGDAGALRAAFPAHAPTARAIEPESAAFIPLLVGDGSGSRRIGAIHLGFRETNRFDEATRAFLLSLAQQCALALDRVRLHEAVRDARRDAEAARLRAERSAYRAGRLLHLATSLSRALTREDVAAVVLDEAMPAFHATGAWVVHEGSGGGFDVLGMRGVREALIRPLARDGRASRSLSAEVARTGEASFIAVGGPDEWSRRYPDSAEFVAAHDFGVLAALPLRYGGATHGVLAFGLRAQQLADEDREAMLAFAAQCSQSLERARLHAAERAARQAAEHAADRTARLQLLTAALSEALTIGDICDIVTRQGRDAFGASGVAIYRYGADRRFLELLSHVGLSELSRGAFAAVPADAPIPRAQAARTGEPIFLTSQQQIVDDYPAIADAVRLSGRQALAVLPLRGSVETRGSLVFAFDSPCTFGKTDREFAMAIAAQCAQAMERADLARERVRLNRAQRAATRRAEFLADASRALAIPLDRVEVLRRLATLPIPAFADYSIVYGVGDDGLTHRITRAHVSQVHERVLDVLEEEFPLAPGSEMPPARVLRTQETSFMPVMSVDALRAVAPDARYLELLHALGPCSAIVVPLVARGRALGALVLAMAEQRCAGSGRQFTRHDLALAESLAERAALALDALLALREAERARAESEHANRAKSDFLATMSHELRTPLNAIAGYVQLLDMEIHGPVTPAQRDALTRIGRAQERLLGLINDILNFARLEAGRVEYDVRPTDVAGVVTEVCSLMEPQLAARALGLDVDVAGDADGAPVRVHADGDKLAQVLLNLLSNAVKFTSAGGRVRIELVPHAVDASRAELRVGDTGIGIPPEKLHTIFEPFVQIGRGLTTTLEGTGLGLAISRDLVRGMGGELTVESTPGVGSVFRIELLRA